MTIPWKGRIEPYPKQRAAIFDPPRHSIVAASPKAGKTLGALNWIIEETGYVGGANHRFLWVAPAFSQSKIAFRRAYLEVLDHEEIHVLKNPPEITLPDGSVLVFASGDREDLLFGEDHYAIVVDEGTRLKEDAWIAAQSTLNHTHGRIRVIGNQTNKRNWAYRLGVRVQKGELEEWEYHRLTQEDAIEAGIVNTLQDAEARSLFTDDVYQTLYMAEVGDDGAIQIDIDKLDRLEVPEMVTWARAWDFAATTGGDWTVGAKIAGNHEGFWIVDIVRERRAADDVPDLIRQTATTDGPHCDQVLEEEKGSSGSIFVGEMRRQLDMIPTAGPVWPADVEQNKIIRSWPLAVAIKEGKYHLAPDFDASELLPELEAWPDSRYDDQLDALAHAHNHIAPMVQGLVGSGWTPGT